MKLKELLEQLNKIKEKHGYDMSVILYDKEKIHHVYANKVKYSEDDGYMGTIYNNKKTTNYYVERQGKFLFFNVWIECLTPMPNGEDMPVHYATFNEALKYICDRIYYKKLLFNSKTVNNVTVFSADLNTFDKDKFYEANKRDSDV